MIGLTSMLISAARHRNAVPPPPAYYPYLKTQIGEEAPVNQGTDPEGLTALPLPSVEGGTSVIAESPVPEGPLGLFALSLPTVGVGDTELRYPDWVTYDGHFNTGGDVPTDDGYYCSGDTVTAEGPGTLVKAGYSFGHWNTKIDGSGTVVATSGDYTITAPTTFYAMWYGDIVVVYLGNGSTGGDPPTDGNTYTEDDTVTVLGQNTLVRSAYEFAGWDTIPDGSGTHYDEDDTFTVGDLPVYLYAQWAFLGSQWVAWGFNPFDPLYDASSDVLSNQLFTTDD